ncbi:hypothetical protein Droror1_Dr00022924 [Drosera rotundifolia]
MSDANTVNYEATRLLHLLLFKVRKDSINFVPQSSTSSNFPIPNNYNNGNVVAKEITRAITQTLIKVLNHLRPRKNNQRALPSFEGLEHLSLHLACWGNSSWSAYIVDILNMSVDTKDKTCMK